MGILELSTAMENLEFLMDRLRQSARNRSTGSQDLLALCDRRRQFACGLLLGDLDVTGFRRLLTQSARAFLWMLSNRETLPLEPYYQCRGRALPMLDAVAAGRLDVARAIAGRLASPLERRLEAEGDHRYLEYVGDVLLLEKPGVPILEAYAQAHDESRGHRYEWALALESRSEGAAWNALRARTQEWRDDVDARRRADAIDPLFAVTEANVFVEGVAMARLAASKGMEPPEPLPFIPAETLEAVGPDGLDDEVP